MLKGKLLKPETASSTSQLKGTLLPKACPSPRSLEEDLQILEGYRSLYSEDDFARLKRMTEFVWELKMRS